jgi:hypothetical protein
VPNLVQTGQGCAPCGVAFKPRWTNSSLSDTHTALIADLKRTVEEQRAETSQLKALSREQSRAMSLQSQELDELKAKVAKQDSLRQQLLEALVESGSQKLHDDGDEDELVALLSKFEAMVESRSQKLLDDDDGDQDEGKGKGKLEALLSKLSVRDLTSRSVSKRQTHPVPLEVTVSQMEQQMTVMSADIQALKNSDQQLQTALNTAEQHMQDALNTSEQQLTAANHAQDVEIQDARSSTFVRWGNSLCPAGVELDYSGVVGGKGFNETGGGANSLCLTTSPVPGHHDTPSWSAHLYGAMIKIDHDAHFNRYPHLVF